VANEIFEHIKALHEGLRSQGRSRAVKAARAARRAAGDAAEATAVCERALAIKRRVLGADHPGVAVTLQDLGALYLSAGRVEEAEAALSRALAILNHGWERP